ncbi:HAMP domain-containing protein [Streptomyces sp. NPDC004838]
MSALPVKWRRMMRRRAEMPLLGGVRPPIVVLSFLLLAIAGFTAVALGRPAQERVPEAVLTSQQHVAEDGAIGLRTSIDETVADLTRTVGLLSASAREPADAVLDRVGEADHRWKGTAVVDIASGKLLAARGENVPLTGIVRGALPADGGLTPRIVRTENGDSRLLAGAVLARKGEPGRLVVASSGLRIPGNGPDGSRTLAVVDRDARILGHQRGPGHGQAAGTDRQLGALAVTAAAASREHPVSAQDPGAGGFRGISGSLTGESHDGVRTVAGYAALAAPEPGGSTAATGLGLTVLTTTGVAETPATGGDPWFGLVAAGSLLLVGGLTVALLTGAVQKPLVRLVLESRGLARGDPTRPITVPLHGEAARTGHALERLRRQLLVERAPHGTARLREDPTAPPRRRLFGTRAVLALAGVLLMLWSGPLLLALNRAGDSVVVPRQIVSDQRERTATLADRVRRALNEGQTDLVPAASLVGDRTERSRMTEVLDETLARNPRYASLYVVDAHGTVLARAGGEPSGARATEASAVPIRILDDRARAPVIAATAPVSGREGAAVVGELRIGFVNALLKRPGLGEVRLIDAERRVIGANTGYRAFEKVTGSRVDGLVERTRPKAGAGPRPSEAAYRDHGELRIAAAAPLAGTGPAASLDWRVLSEQPASGLAIAEYSRENRTVLAGLFGVTAALLCPGWLHLLVARPLRALADQAEALADGDRRTVLYPRHHDEVGAVTRNLEIIRRELAGQREPGGARTPAGRS